MEQQNKIEEKKRAGIADYFSEIEDPRINRRKEHKLIDIMVIAICAIICGADGWVGIEAFGKAKLNWFNTFLDLPNGIPSHDTFGRVFARIDPQEFESCFLKWIQSAYQKTAGEVIAVDGKCLRRSYDKASNKAAIHMVSAWATKNRVVLGQQKVDSKSNEITAIPTLLKALDLAGCIVTIDAMGCQKDIAAQIMKQKGDYILALKDNHAHLYEDVISLFQWADNISYEELDYDAVRLVNKGHGRIEIRECWTISDPVALAMLADQAKWPGLHTVVRVKATRVIGEERTSETRYYICSLTADTPKLARTALHGVRRHWGVENELHWVLDIAFREDESRIRQGHSAHNMAILRHIALNLLKKESSQHLGIKNKRLLAGWNNDYLLKVLSF